MKIVSTSFGRDHIMQKATDSTWRRTNVNQQAQTSQIATGCGSEKVLLMFLTLLEGTL